MNMAAGGWRYQQGYCHHPFAGPWILVWGSLRPRNPYPMWWCYYDQNLRSHDRIRVVFSVMWVPTQRLGVCTTTSLYLHRHKSGSKCASSTLIVKLWNIIHSLWCHHCNHLHDSQVIHDLNGFALLRKAVIAEYTEVMVPFLWCTVHTFTILSRSLCRKHLTRSKTGS